MYTWSKELKIGLHYYFTAISADKDLLLLMAGMPLSLTQLFV